MSNWFTFKDILNAAQLDLPNTERSLQRYISANGWKKSGDTYRKKTSRSGKDHYHISLLPAPVQLRLKATLNAVENVFEDIPEEKLTREQLWDAYSKLNQEQKDTCQKRLEFLVRVEELIASGSTKKKAIAVASAEFGVSISTHRNWELLVRGFERQDWLAALAPKYNSAPPENTCNKRAWAILKSDYLRPEKPSLASCYRRMKAVAAKEQLEPIPTLRTIRRWVEREVPREVQVMARENKDVSKNLYPAQRRTRTHFHAMQKVNIDGHKFDVFVNFGTKDKPRIVRPMMIAIQDLYSNMIVAHRISDSENKEVIRLCIGDMMEKHGIPEALTTDNGRAFASKQITGGAPTRFRYKVKDEDPNGLLVSMGVDVNWTLPYSGQSKPIERAFRDICDTIARHPFCAGAYTGNNIENAPDNRGSKSIMLEDFIPFVAQEIEAHNRREDRNTEVAKGRSFMAAFNESMALETTLVRMPTAEQRRLWLLANEQVKAKKGSGEITIFDQRYYTPQLSGYAGQKLIVRYDPADLTKPLHVYNNQNQYLFDAPLFADAKFDDVDAARDHSRKRSALLKATKTAADITRELKVDELANIFPAPEPMPEPAPKKVRRLATGGQAIAAPEQDLDFNQLASQTDQTEFEDSFLEAVNRMPENDIFGKNVVPFKSDD